MMSIKYREEKFPNREKSTQMFNRTFDTATQKKRKEWEFRRQGARNTGAAFYELNVNESIYFYDEL